MRLMLVEALKQVPSQHFLENVNFNSDGLEGDQLQFSGEIGWYRLVKM